MEVTAVSPVYVASVEWQRNNRSWVLTVVCKATFDLVPDEMTLARQQEAISDDDQHYDDDPKRSVHAPSDLAPFKARADVTLVGHAFAPGGERVSSLVARIGVGSIDKSIGVFGERTWTPSGPSSGASFSRVALRYERAAGGPGTSNPAGLSGKSGATGPVPNLEALRRGASEDITPVGFGPIAWDWPQRRLKLKTHAKTWDWADWTNQPLPDIDGDFFNVAPTDQQLATLQNDEAITLEHLHPRHPRLRTRLPGVHPVAFVDRPNTPPQPLLMRADGLWIDTDRAICTVTWRAPLPLAARGEAGRVLVAITTRSDQTLGFTDLVALVKGEGPTSRRENVIIDDPTSDDGEELFNQTVAMRIPKGESAASAPSAPSGLPFRKASPTALSAAAAPPPPIASIAVSPPAPPPPTPTAERPFEPERTNTDFFVASEAPILDASPAWLAQGARSDAAPVSSAVDRGMLVMPAAAAAAATVSTPRPPVDRSPWASGPIGTPAAQAIATAAPAAAVAVPRGAIASPIVDAPKAATAAAARAARPASNEVVDLLWFDPASVPRVRSAWPKIIDDLEFEPLDPRQDLPVDDPSASRERHHVFGVLTRADAMDKDGIVRAMFEAVGDRGRFTPPVVLIVGELRFPLEDVEILKTAAACAEPIAKDDKRLTDLLQSVAELVKSPLLQGASGVTDGMLREIKDAIAQSKRPMPVKYLDAHIERVLLEQRRYQKRTVFGEPMIRALFVPTKDNAPIPAYLPESLANKLPLVTQMRARLLAEAHTSQDQYEAHSQALRIIALGRSVAIEGFRR